MVLNVTKMEENWSQDGFKQGVKKKYGDNH
jgi:hypothetical protein